MNAEARTAAARAFVRSLNILLKYARLYEFGHARTAAQFETAWDELQGALDTDTQAGILLSAAGNQLLLDGEPLKSAAAEKSFAQLLSSAGIASIHFAPHVTQQDLARFVRAFPTGVAKAEALAGQLRVALEGTSGIRVNEIRFVPEDSAIADVKVAALLTAKALGVETYQSTDWFNDPQKLLQLIAAAEGSRSRGPGGDGPGGGGPGGGGPGGSGSGGGGPAGAGRGGPGSAGGYGSGAARLGPWATTITAAGLVGTARGSGGVGAAVAEPGGRATGAGFLGPGEEDLKAIVKLLTQLGKSSREAGALPEPVAFHQRLSSLPIRAQYTLRQALASLAAQAPTDKPDKHLLLKLAEHVAIRFALDSYERGEVRVNAVRQMLDRMGKEIESLRKVLVQHEEKMARAGVLTQSHTDILEQQFWEEVPEDGKKNVLMSPEAWCVPPRNIRQFVEDLLKRGELKTAQEILRNYAACINYEETPARQHTAMGLAELAEFYASGDGQLLVDTLKQVGKQLNSERDPELQSMVSAAFVRLTQEAAAQRCYPAMLQAVESVDNIEKERPAFGQSLRPRIGVEKRLPEFIEEALRAESIPADLANLLRLVLRPAAEQLTSRFGRSGFREDCDLLIEMMRALGSDGVFHLVETLRTGPPAQAVETVGMLSRLEPAALEQWLPVRLCEWQRSAHDRVVRQLAAGGAPERGRLLLAVLDQLDPLIRALALDEIGMSGDASTVPRLVRLADGELRPGAGPYLRLKAIEALGKLLAQEAVPVLRRIVGARTVWRWTHPSELRIVAAQALAKIDPDWAREFLLHSGLDPAELSLAPAEQEPHSSCIRQRRYPRAKLSRPLTAVTTNLRENCRMEIREMNLGGGVAVADRHLPPGTLIALKLNASLRPIRAQAFVRDARTQAMGFEIADIELEERAKLRRLLVELGGAPHVASSRSRSRRRDRAPASAR